MIHFYNVSKRFGENKALSQINLHIRRGEFLLLTGPCGAGKTTLLRTIFAAEKPDEGQIVLAGRNITRLKRSYIPHLRRSIGVVFQDFKLLGERSVLQNVSLPLEIRGLPPKEVRQRSMAMLKAVGLSEVAAMCASSLSGGEQQRVAVARAAVGQPEILLADEPTGNLDPERAQDTLELFESIARQGTTVVLATHDPMVVKNAAPTRVVTLEQGKIVGLESGIAEPVESGSLVWPAFPPSPETLLEAQI